MTEVGSSLAHALRWGVFSVRRAAYSVYGGLRFASKPGARVIVPVLLAVGAYLGRAPLEAFIDSDVLHAPWREMPEPLTLEVVSGVALVAFLCVCAVISSCLFHIQWIVGKLFGLVRFVIRLAVLLLLIGLGAALYFDLPLDERLLGYLPFGIDAELPDAAAYVSNMQWPQWEAPGALWALHGLLALAVLVVACVYVVVSRGLALVLGAFPPMVAPLPPMRALRVKEAVIRPVAVSIAVPRLPRRRRA